MSTQADEVMTSHVAADAIAPRPNARPQLVRKDQKEQDKKFGSSGSNLAADTMTFTSGEVLSPQRDQWKNPTRPSAREAAEIQGKSARALDNAAVAHSSEAHLSERGLQSTALHLGRHPLPCTATNQTTSAHAPFFDAASRRSFVLKRSFDVVVATAVLVIFSPLLLVISALIFFKGRGVPIIYGHIVVGRGGRRFRMWKFSTMVANAHVVLRKLLEENSELREEWQRHVKLRNDPRVLPGIGGFLRRTSINELPQLLNVLKGDMSLVGPRPISKAEEKLYLLYGSQAMLKARHAQRPGITGLWQATSRSDASYQERVRLDSDYLREQSFALDLKIILQTVRKVISREGAV